MCAVSSTTLLIVLESTAPVESIIASDVSGDAIVFRSIAPSIRTSSHPSSSISSQRSFCSAFITGPAICTYPASLTLHISSSPIAVEYFVFRITSSPASAISYKSEGTAASMPSSRYTLGFSVPVTRSCVSPSLPVEVIPKTIPSSIASSIR